MMKHFEIIRKIMRTEIEMKNRISPRDTLWDAFLYPFYNTRVYQTSQLAILVLAYAVVWYNGKCLIW